MTILRHSHSLPHQKEKPPSYCEPEKSLNRTNKGRGVSFLLFFIFLLLLFFRVYLGLFFETIHKPLSLGEGTLAEDDSLQIQAYLVLDRREEVRQAP